MEILIKPNKKLFARFRSRRLSERIVYATVFLIFSAVALSYIYVFYWGVTGGLKTHAEISLSPFSFPEKPQFRNYIDVFPKLNVAGYGFFGMLFNSLFFAILGPLITNFTTAKLAYVTNKYKFPGARLYFIVITFTMILPIYGSGGSMYRLLYNLGFVNSYSQIILAFSGMNGTYLYFYAAFSNLSWDYAEAARIDGANDYTIYYRIMLPQVMAIFGAFFLMGCVGEWNNFQSILIYMPKLPTLAGGIYMFELDMVYHARRDLLYAAYMVTAVPPLILFIVFNKALTSNISLGGIKE